MESQLLLFTDVMLSPNYVKWKRTSVKLVCKRSCSSTLRPSRRVGRKDQEHSRKKVCQLMGCHQCVLYGVGGNGSD